MCNGSGVVPLSVSPGDRVRLLVSDRLPADGTIYGRDRTGTPEWFAAVYAPADAWLTNTDARWLPLRPGSVWTATVTDVLPIIDSYTPRPDGCVVMFDYDDATCPYWVWYRTAFDYERITEHTAWQPGAWTSGSWVLRLNEWTEAS
jgi:hypothetical protein